MNNTPSIWDMLRDMFQFHIPTPRASWLPALCIAAAVVSVVVLLGAILRLPPYYRQGLPSTVAICWAVSTLCAYVAGFVVARLSSGA